MVVHGLDRRYIQRFSPAPRKVASATNRDCQLRLLAESCHPRTVTIAAGLKVRRLTDAKRATTLLREGKRDTALWVASVPRPKNPLGLAG